VRVHLFDGEDRVGFVLGSMEPWVNETGSKYGQWKPLSACETVTWPTPNTAGRARMLYIHGDFSSQVALQIEQEQLGVDDEPDASALRQSALLLLAADTLLAGDAWTAEGALAFAKAIESSLDEPMYARGKHAGDCTKQPFTCSRCVIEKYEDEALLLWVLDQ
jgi:hypothetical protein